MAILEANSNGVQNGKQPTPNDPLKLAQGWLTLFQKACTDVSADPNSEASVKDLLSLFHSDGWWRDKLCLTWTFRTREGTEQIKSYIREKHALAKTGIKGCYIDSSTGLEGPSHSVEPDQYGSLLSFVTFLFRFKTSNPPASGRGVVKLSEDSSGSWKAHVLFTGLESLDGHAENLERPSGHYENHTRSLKSIQEQKLREAIEKPTVLIIGGGQSGIFTAARMVNLGLRVLVVEKTSRIGDIWRNRYDLLTLHTPSNFSQMPYGAYPKNMPEWMPKDKFADHLEFFAKFQDIPVLNSAEMLPSPKYDADSKLWTVTIRHENKELLLRPKHLVMAIGTIGETKTPDVPNQDLFKGSVYHSDKHKSCEGWKGKKVVIVGAGVTGTDIALEADESGAEVTLVQRSPMVMVRLQNTKKGLHRLYPDSRLAEDSDWLRETIPWPYFIRMCNNVFVPHAEQEEKELHENLRKRGFMVGWGEEVGLGRLGHLGLVYTKLGGFCVDVGCAERIVDGRIKMRPKVVVERFESDGVIYSDGTKEQADIVIFATGYHTMPYTLVKLFGSDFFPDPPKIWGFDDEGEINGAFKETEHPRLWYAVGGIPEARSWSKFLAIRILAEELCLLEK